MGSFCVSTYFPFRASSPSRVMETQCLSAEGSQSLWGLETYSGPRHRGLGTSLSVLASKPRVFTHAGQDWDGGPPGTVKRVVHGTNVTEGGD